MGRSAEESVSTSSPGNTPTSSPGKMPISSLGNLPTQSDEKVSTVKLKKSSGGSSSSIRSFTRAALRALLLLCGIYAAVYKPLPPAFTATTLDRTLMHIIEPTLRLTYYYPTRICPDIRCMVWWTRLTLNTLAGLIGPIVDWDPQMHMETTHFDGVKVRVYTMRASAANETRSDGAVIFIHGGGFVLGNIQMYESLTRRMAKRLRARLFISVDYRLAPETFFPGGLEDCERVVEYVMREGPTAYGIDPSKIVLMGDSAGGNLVAAITQRRKERNASPPVLGQVLMYPLLQLSDLQSASYRYFHRELDGFALVDPLSVAYYYMYYAGLDVLNHPEWAHAAVTNGHVDDENRRIADEILDYSSLPAHFQEDGSNGTVTPRAPVDVNEEARAALAPLLSNPDFAPIMRKNLTGLPPALVMTVEFDVLRDEGAMYAKRLADAGVPTNWVHYEHGFHAMLNFHNELQIATDAMNKVIDWSHDLIVSAKA